MNKRLTNLIVPFSGILFFLAISSNGLCAKEKSAFANNWPAWRGLYNSGAVSAGNTPVEFSETKNIKWKTEIPGKGHATSIVWGNQSWKKITNNITVLSTWPATNSQLQVSIFQRQIALNTFPGNPLTIPANSRFNKVGDTLFIGRVVLIQIRSMGISPSVRSRSTINFSSGEKS